MASLFAFSSAFQLLGCEFAAGVVQSPRAQRLLDCLQKSIYSWNEILEILQFILNAMNGESDASTGTAPRPTTATSQTTATTDIPRYAYYKDLLENAFGLTKLRQTILLGYFPGAAGDAMAAEINAESLRNNIDDIFACPLSFACFFGLQLEKMSAFIKGKLGKSASVLVGSNQDSEDDLLEVFGYSDQRMKFLRRPGICGMLSEVKSGILDNADTFNVIPTMIAGCNIYDGRDGYRQGTDTTMSLPRCNPWNNQVDVLAEQLSKLDPEKLHIPISTSELLSRTENADIIRLRRIDLTHEIKDILPSNDGEDFIRLSYLPENERGFTYSNGNTVKFLSYEYETLERYRADVLAQRILLSPINTDIHVKFAKPLSEDPGQNLHYAKITVTAEIQDKLRSHTNFHLASSVVLPLEGHDEDENSPELQVKLGKSMRNLRKFVWVPENTKANSITLYPDAIEEPYAVQDFLTGILSYQGEGFDFKISTSASGPKAKARIVMTESKKSELRAWTQAPGAQNPDDFKSLLTTGSDPVIEFMVADQTASGGRVLASVSRSEIPIDVKQFAVVTLSNGRFLYITFDGLNYALVGGRVERVSDEYTNLTIIGQAKLTYPKENPSPVKFHVITKTGANVILVVLKSNGKFTWSSENIVKAYPFLTDGDVARSLPTTLTNVNEAASSSSSTSTITVLHPDVNISESVRKHKVLLAIS